MFRVGVRTGGGAVAHHGAPLRDSAAAAAGVSLPFAFSPFELWPLALLALSMLYWACLEGSTWRLAVRGGAFGLGSFGVGVSWIHESFQFSNIGLPIAVALTVVFVVFLSCYPALVCAVFARLYPTRVRAHPAAALAFAATYVLCEWLRGWLLSGFTWLQLGYSQVDGPFGPLLPVLGVYGVGLLMAAIACTAAAAVHGGWRALCVSVGLAAIAAGALLGIPARWTSVDGQPLRVAIVQGNVSQDRKWQPAMLVPTLERYARLTRLHLDDSLVVWPETSIPALRRRVAPFLERLGNEARSRNSTVLVGLPELDPASGKTYNTVELIGRDGGSYRKQHLVPFGEFLPLAVVLRPVTRALGIPVSNFSPGASTQGLLRIHGYLMAAFICYEIAFGAEVAGSLPDARVLITVSNDAWFGDSLGPLQHLQMARARALETGRYLIRSTNTGVSVVVDPAGAVILELPQFQVAHGEAEVLPMAGSTPYTRSGDTPVLVLCLLALVWGRVRRKPAPGVS